MSFSEKIPGDGFELPPAEEKASTTLLAKKGGAYTTTLEPERTITESTSPTDLARKTTSIKIQPLDCHGAERVLNSTQTFRPMDIYDNMVPNGRNRYGLTEEDELPWDFAVAFDIPDEDDEHEDIESYVNSKWAHPARHLREHVEANKSRGAMKREATSKAKKQKTRERRKSKLEVLKETVMNALDERHKFELRDLVAVFFNIAATGVVNPDYDEEATISPPTSPSTSNLGNVDEDGTKAEKKIRLCQEDREWLVKLDKEKRNNKQAPSIKRWPGIPFFERIFHDVAEGRDYLDKRRFAIAKSFVIIGLLADQCSLTTYCEWSSGGDQMFCKLRAEAAELRVMADKQDYSMAMGPHLDHRCPIPAHLEYDQDPELDWLWHRHGVKLENGDLAWSRFRRVDRLKLIDAHIDDFLVLRRFMKIDLVAAYFPCDDAEEKELRELDWEKPLNVPHIREYYGERVALYFAFLEHYKGSLFFIAFVGLIVQFWQVAERYIPGLTSKETGIPEDLGSLIFSAVIAVWGTLFLEHWKRKEATLNTQWGMSDFEAKEEARPEFIGELRESVTIGTLARRRADETEQDLEAKAWADTWRKARGMHTRDDNDQSMIVDWIGKPKMWASEGTRQRRLYISVMFTSGFLLVTITSTISIFIMRAALRYSGGGVYTAGVVGGGTNAILIMGLQALYNRLTVYMTDWENWETATEWEDSRAIKSFVFNFVNSFGSFFYIAFYRKENDGGCIGACEHSTFGSLIDLDRCPKVAGVLGNYSTDGIRWPSNMTFTSEYKEYLGDCVMEMWIQLAMIFMSRLIIGNILEIGFPVMRAYLWNEKIAQDRQDDLKFVENRLKEKQQNSSVPVSDEQFTPSSSSSTHPKRRATLTQVLPRLALELNSGKQAYDTFGDYEELVQQVGFLSLFVVCFPLAPMIAMLSLEAEVKIDLYKLFEMNQHPVPQGAQDIGKWQYFMESTLYVAAMTNAGMFAFTTDVMASQTFPMKLIAFAFFVIFVQAVKGVCAFLIPDVPEEIKLIRLRHQSLNDSLIKGAELWDDDDEEYIESEKFEVKIYWGEGGIKMKPKFIEGKSLSRAVSMSRPDSSSNLTEEESTQEKDEEKEA